MPRTASQIGSLKSSPSTSTVKNPVIEPCRKLPARSKIFGRSAKHRRRVAFLAGRLAGGQSDLALSHGQARDRIHDQQDVGALVAEILGDGHGDETGADAQRRGRSEVATTTTERSQCLQAPDRDREMRGPRGCARRSGRSRLRRPNGFAHMAPSNVLLPTPLPPNSPMRCPMPQGSRLSMRTDAGDQAAR